MLRHLILPLLALGALPVMSAAGQVVSLPTASYHIGNSLTLDSQPLSLEAFAAMAGREHRSGYDIRPGEPLHKIVAEPELSTTGSTIYSPEFGRFAAALPNHKWTSVTMQPHINGGSTMASDVSSIISLIDLTRSNPLNADTTFYIYAAWPQYGNYQDKWNAPIFDGNNTPTAHARQYYTHLINRVRAATDAEVLMIPVGDVLNEIDVRLRQHAVEGYQSVHQFYRDGLHLNDALGRYTAAVTSFATMFNRNSEGLTRPPGFFPGNPLNADQIYALINDVVHDVVEGHQFSGIDLFPYPPASDLNLDGVVDDHDLSIWTGVMGKSDVADADFDGDVDEADFQALQGRFGQVLRKTENFDAADVDRSGLVDSEDLAVWLGGYGPGSQFDLDGDGYTDGADFLTWQRSTNPEFFFEDFNRDGYVDNSDVELWNANAGYTSTADVDNDGLVDGADFLAWQREVGEVWPVAAPAATSVPEPSSYLLGVLAVMGCEALRRRRPGRR